MYLCVYMLIFKGEKKCVGISCPLMGMAPYQNFPFSLPVLRELF